MIFIFPLELGTFAAVLSLLLYNNMSDRLKKRLRNRIKSVTSTQQITKAMKMVSAAELRRAQDSNNSNAS
jgi:hypothetical protein